MASRKSKQEATRTCQAGQAALAARLLKRISAETAATGNNLVFSPLSIHVALALMSTAAAGDTLDEILRVAGAPSREELAAFVRGTVVDGVLADQSGIGGPSISFACGTWTDKKCPLRPAYVDAVVGTFKGNSWAVDFQNEVTTNYMKSCLDMHECRSISTNSIASSNFFLDLYMYFNLCS